MPPPSSKSKPAFCPIAFAMGSRTEPRFSETSAADFVISWIAVVVPPSGVVSGVIAVMNPIPAAVEAAVTAIEPLEMDPNRLILGAAAVAAVPAALAVLAAA